jgi:hypothetical protein
MTSIISWLYRFIPGHVIDPEVPPFPVILTVPVTMAVVCLSTSESTIVCPEELKTRKPYPVAPTLEPEVVVLNE